MVIKMGMKKILGCVRKADQEFNMIQDGDRICVGVSGGKDSTLLLYALSLYQRFADVSFEVIGVHIEMGFPDMKFDELNRFMKDKHIELYHYHSDIYQILQINKNPNGTLKCSLCSKFKKATVIEAAKQHNCQKVAFAHHSDDATETLLMNMIFGGKIATFLPQMYLDRTDIQFIRPLLYAYESDIQEAIQEANIPVVTSTCPNDKHTEREEMKKMLQELYKKYPQAKHNFQLMLSNENQTMLWHKTPRKKEKDED